MEVRAFITHKLSEQYSDCQDRFSIDDSRKSVALSDGMSQSIFPDYWAEILSRFYVENGHCTEDDRKELCGEWKKKVSEYIKSKKAEGREPWRLQNSLSENHGAGATICGLTFDESNHWTGHVLGDSCIIEVNIEDTDNPFVEKIHTSQEKPFDSYPDFYDSIPSRAGRGKIKEFEGDLDEKHIILLVTDPLSEYLSTHKEDRKVCAKWLKRIIELSTHDEYCSLIDEWRADGLHNDDSTLLIVEYGNNDGEMHIGYQDDIEELMQGSQISTDPGPANNNSIAKEKGETSTCESNKTVDDEENPGNVSKEPTMEESTDLNSAHNHAGNLECPNGIIKILKQYRDQIIGSCSKVVKIEKESLEKLYDAIIDSLKRLIQ